MKTETDKEALLYCQSLVTSQLLHRICACYGGGGPEEYIKMEARFG